MLGSGAGPGLQLRGADLPVRPGHRRRARPASSPLTRVVTVHSGRGGSAVDWWAPKASLWFRPGPRPGLSDSRPEERTLASEGFHEPLELLDEATLDYHRAMTSLCEELEAIDWYDQRVQATADESLAAVLAYNRDDEKEHAAMALEWLRRRDGALDTQLRKFLFTSGPITEVGEADGGPSAPPRPARSASAA